MENEYPGKFIVFEGLDGSGQSTQTNLLKHFLSKQGYSILITKEPTLDSQAGKLIRSALDKEKELSPKELQQLFAEDRKEHVNNVIIPALEVGTWVISDRYFFSSFAFGASDGIDIEWLIEINKGFPLPDATFLLEVRPEICVQRIQSRGKPQQLFEYEEKLKNVWEGYKKVADRFNGIHIIDGEQSIEKVAEDVTGIIQDTLF
ncbi:MAG: dTMP kinase [Patescibacteria group bacterium]|nr:dTMP kinase [Patescibacteria group bacterium]